MILLQGIANPQKTHLVDLEHVPYRERFAFASSISSSDTSLLITCNSRCLLSPSDEKVFEHEHMIYNRSGCPSDDCHIERQIRHEEL